MAEETRVVNAVNWREVFTFTHVFRAFRIAVHPSKLILALAALLAIYVAGRTMDRVWPDKYRAVPGEIVGAVVRANDPGDTDALLRDLMRNRGGRDLDSSQSFVQRQYANRLREVNALKGNQLGLDKPEAVETAVKEVKYLPDVKFMLVEQRDAAVKKLLNEYDNLPAEKKTKEAQKALDLTVARGFAAVSAEYKSYANLNGQGLFFAFFAFETAQVRGVIEGAIALNTTMVVRAVENFFITGPKWAFTKHPVYFSIFGVLFLAIWAVLGGAIARIAAVHVARDEKISVRAALKFSMGKFLSFFFAPLIPIGIVYGLGVVVWLVALALGWIPGVGPILIGLLFALALAAGFMMALVLLGLGGGFNLMYPTIATEGSDSFDAISRSFSYLYARPWRLLLHTSVAIIYGAITFSFVRLFIAWTLRLTHFFVSQGIYRDAANRQDWFDVAWPISGGSLTYAIDEMALGGAQVAGAYMMAFWIYLTIGLLGAFAISFYFSANTIIYFLMRREVDATEMDDVYVEQAEEEFAEPTPAPAAATASTTLATAPAPSTPAPEASTPAPATPPAENPPAASTENKPPDQPMA